MSAPYHGPVVLVHLEHTERRWRQGPGERGGFVDERSGLTACSGDKMPPSDEGLWPGVPRLLCPLCAYVTAKRRTT